MVQYQQYPLHLSSSSSLSSLQPSLTAIRVSGLSGVGGRCSITSSSCNNNSKSNIISISTLHPTLSQAINANNNNSNNNNQQKQLHSLEQPQSCTLLPLLEAGKFVCVS